MNWTSRRLNGFKSIRNGYRTYLTNPEDGGLVQLYKNDGFEPDGYDYIDNLDNCEDWETIRCDENATTEERVKAMDMAFNRACGALGELDEDLFPFEKVLDTVAELEKYQSSGLWKKDFEADEAGELPPDAARGVLSEDGLYNFLQDFDRIMEKLKKITENR